jgi:VRR-NUC domain
MTTNHKLSRTAIAQTLHRHNLTNTITEKAFQHSVLELAQLTGWLTYHTFDSRRSQPGFPDLVMVKDSRLLFVELKREEGKPSPEQTKWLETLARVEKVSSHLWKPSDWPRLERMLKAEMATPNASIERS